MDGWKFYFKFQLPNPIYTLNNAGLFEPKYGENFDKPKCWVKNVISILTQLQLSLPTVIFFCCIFNPTFGFVHTSDPNYNPAFLVYLTKRPYIR